MSLALNIFSFKIKPLAQQGSLTKNSKLKIQNFTFPSRHSVQKHLFMQNEPNFKNTKMNINCYTTNNYNENCGCEDKKNEPKRTQLAPSFSPSACRGGVGDDIRNTRHLFMQNKANLQGDEMNVTYYKKTSYNENRPGGESKNKPKTNAHSPNHKNRKKQNFYIPYKTTTYIN